MILLRAFLAALGFLTVAPLPARWREDREALSRSVPLFPVIGVAAGFLVACCDVVFMHLLPVWSASVLTAIAMIAVSGGLHIDGLSDTADGFFSARTGEKALEIMRDSRIGAMGVVAIASAFALKVALLLSLHDGRRFDAIWLMPIAGRCAMLTPMSLLPYARPEGGLASLFQERRSSAHALWADVFVLAAGRFLLGPAGIVAAIVVIAAAHALSVAIRRRIGGMTGDTLGAVCEICELLPAMTLLVCQRFSVFV